MVAARAAIDAAEFDRAIGVIDGVLRTLTSQDAEGWPLRVMRVEAMLGKGDRTALNELAAEPPVKYRHSDAAVRRLTYLGGIGEQGKLLAEAEAIARQYQPHLLGMVYRGKALLSGSESDARMAIQYARRYKDRETEAKSFATLARILAKERRYLEAVEAGESAIALTSLPNVIQNAQGTLGWAYFEVGDYELADELLTKAENAAKASGNAVNRASWLIVLGNVRFQRRDYDGAEAYNIQALESPQILPSDRGFALANRARIALAQGKFDKARQLNQLALQAKREAKDGEAQMSSAIVEARIVAGKDGGYASAEKLLLDVLRETKQNRLDAQTQLAKLYVSWRRYDRAETAFRQAVKTAREMRKEIEDTELQLSFFNTVSEMLDAYVDFLVDRDRRDDALAVAEASRAELLEEGRPDTARDADPRQIARQKGSTILSYWLGRDRSYLWVITPAGTKLVLLPADTIVEREVSAYQREVLRSSPTSLARGERLYAMLVAPANIAPGSRVIVIADGQLHMLNLETLVVPGTRRYWIHDAIVSSAPSLQLLTRKPREIPASPSLLLVGNTPSPDPVSYPALANASNEMRAIEQRFKRSVVLEGAKATLAAYRAASPGKFDYLHFVAHGVAAPRRPLDSFIVLAPGRPSYKLMARDIENEPLNARLVTISSCEGAGKSTYTGEGIVGLAWAFLHAGADKVVASLWKVNDTASAEVMKNMYARLRAGDDPALALRAAKLQWMKSNPIAAKPVYWAPFVLYAGT